jgi:hypothetical protein
MKGDFSRDTFDPARHYSSVRMQQGRVQVDADWNEQIAIAAHREETETRDVIGLGGGPQQGAGLRIVAQAAALTADEAAAPGNASPPPLAGAGDFLITAGRYYVGGWLVEADRITHYRGQDDFPGAPVLAAAGTYFVYVDAWQRHVTALEAPSLREVALGGPDTATRTKTLWQVRFVRVGGVADALHCLSMPLPWSDVIAAPSGRIAARAEPGETGTSPCVVPAGAGFRRLENQLYRVEVHAGGPRGTATFKWSRDNGAVAVRWESQLGNEITVSAAGRDRYLSFAAGQWVELIDDARELRAEPGTLVRIASVEGRVLTLDPASADGPITIASFGANPRVRRWDSAGSLRPTNANWIDLEDGVQVRVASGSYRGGDHWLIPARTATADIEWPRDAATDAPLDLPPFGIEHRTCKLAVLRFDGAAITEVLDCRDLFPPLTALGAFFYLGGDGQEALPGAVLDRPLRAGVSNGTLPVARARVRFTRVGTAGSLLVAPGAVEEPGGTAASRIVLTDAEGEAEVRLQLGAPSADVTHEVLAEWLDVAGTPRHLPIRFVARASVAAQTWYDGSGCPALADVDTVQEAIATLADQALIRMLGGDAQPIQRGTPPLTRALEVAVVSACGPVAGARVRFQPQGLGRAAAALADLPASTGAVELTTDMNGIASAFWQPDPDPAPNVQTLRAIVVNAGTRRIRAPGEVVFMALRGAERCHDFLDELRSDGVVRDAENNSFGLRVGFDPGGPVPRVFFTGGIAYVAGCRFVIRAGQVALATDGSPNRIFVDMDGQVQASALGPFPRALALLADVHMAGGDVVHVVDRRRDLTHLDERVDTVHADAAARRADRRAGIPLLVQTLPNLRARDLRQHESPAPGAFGMAFDGEAMWVASVQGGSFRMSADGPLGAAGAVTPVPLGAPVFRAAYDGVAHVWFSAPTVQRVIAVNKATRRVVPIDQPGTPFALAAGGGLMWVGNLGANSVSAYDTGTLQRRFTTSLAPANAGQPMALAFDGTLMWVGTTNGRLVRLRGDGTIADSFGFNDIGLRGLAFDGALMWLVIGAFATEGGSVERADAVSAAPAALGARNFAGEELLCDGSVMWTYDATRSAAAQPAFRSTLTRRDCATAQPRDTIAFNEVLACWAFDGTHLWAASFPDGSSLDTARVRKLLVA